MLNVRTLATLCAIAFVLGAVVGGNIAWSKATADFMAPATHAELEEIDKGQISKLAAENAVLRERCQGRRGSP